MSIPTPTGEPVRVPVQAAAAGLSSRELEVLTGMADGLDNKKIAARLFLSEETIKSYVKKLLAHLEAENRTHAVAIGFRRGLIA